MIQLNGTRRRPWWPALCQGAKRGLFASAQARSGTLAMPTSARPAGGQGASQSAAQRRADGSAARASTGGTETSASSGGTAGSTATSVGSRTTAATSSGDPRGQGPSRQPPAPVPLRPMIRIRRGALIQRRSREGAPPLTPGRRCPRTSRVPCGGTAYQWPRVCSTVRRWRRAL